MMSKVTFPLLLSIYRNLAFDSNANGGTLTLSSQDLRDTLALLLEEENLDDSGISLASGNPDKLVVGQTVRLLVGEPRLGIGVLARNLNGLLRTRKARIEEPKKYFLIDLFKLFKTFIMKLSNEICQVLYFIINSRYHFEVFSYYEKTA